MEHSEDCLLALTVEAVRSEGGTVRLHVQRMDRPVDYGYLSPAELYYLIEALLAPADTPGPPQTSSGPTPLRPPGHELSHPPRNLPGRHS